MLNTYRLWNYKGHNKVFVSMATEKKQCYYFADQNLSIYVYNGLAFTNIMALLS